MLYLFETEMQERECRDDCVQVLIVEMTTNKMTAAFRAIIPPPRAAIIALDSLYSISLVCLHIIHHLSAYVTVSVAKREPKQIPKNFILLMATKQQTTVSDHQLRIRHFRDSNGFMHHEVLLTFSSPHKILLSSAVDVSDGCSSGHRIPSLVSLSGRQMLSVTWVKTKLNSDLITETFLK